MKKQFILFIILVWVLTAAVASIFLLTDRTDSPQTDNQLTEQRLMCVAFDDLPGVGGDALTMRKLNESILETIRKHKIPAIGFVNEDKLYWTGNPQPFIEILQLWVDAGLELGNHTFSHIDANAVPIDDYKVDVIRGEEVTTRILAQVGKKLRYFRHPYLHTGSTEDYERDLNIFLAQRGYTVAPVTNNNREWLYAAVYTDLLNKGDSESAKKVGNSYVAYMDSMLTYWQNISLSVVGYDVSHILLLHANQLNADYFDKLVDIIKSHSYQFISIDKAMQDKAYQLPTTHTKEGYSWLFRWMMAKGMNPPQAPQPDKFVLDIYDSMQTKDQHGKAGY